MKYTRKTQTWITDGDALKEYLKSLPAWSFVRRSQIEQWANLQKPKLETMSPEIYDDMLFDYATNCIAYAKRYKWIRYRTNRPKMWQILPIA